MPSYLSPGVYMEEVDRGSKPIESVGTAVAAFIGYTEKATDVKNGQQVSVVGKPTVACTPLSVRPAPITGMCVPVICSSARSIAPCTVGASPACR